MIAEFPHNDEIVLTRPEDGQLCNSLGCRQAGRTAVLVVTYGVLNDTGAGYHDRRALWRECWGQSYAACSSCWKSAHQVAFKYRPKLVVIDKTSLAFLSTSPRGLGMAATTRPSGTPSNRIEYD
jgi:hypothetical protein